MSSPITNAIGAIFIPVSNIERARHWYSDLLNVPQVGEIMFGHIYCLPMQGGTNVVLDSKIFDPASVRNAPLFHFNTDDIHASYQLLKEKGIELVTGIENDHWFTFKDPDGNVLMVCKC
ncbi:VOC family protein [Brevibacillus fluminis]|uniref:VOC family protein n=1 Tax=Brevibacillus fluminis TaxID=511487 RepID=A0A3M8DU50_9BACL|nr:VOC family protein [Brevibacillus fluminis]RNB91626.1 VOC family protein [Brevibacillus fluminis]